MLCCVAAAARETSRYFVNLPRFHISHQKRGYWSGHYFVYHGNVVIIIDDVKHLAGGCGILVSITMRTSGSGSMLAAVYFISTACAPGRGFLGIDK